MKTQATPKSAIRSHDRAHTPSPTLTRLASLACALGLAGSALAQNIPRQPYADSTHTVRLLGDPPRTDQCPAGQVRSGGQCVALPTGGGATLLPYSPPAEQTYVNGAGYPLLVTATPTGTLDNPGSCYELSLWVDGQLTTFTRDDCEGSRTSVQAIVPAGSSFAVQNRNGNEVKLTSIRVTAMANGAKWQDTGIFWTWTEEQTIKSTSVRVPDPSSCWYYITYRTYYRFQKDNYGGSTRVGPLDSESNNWEQLCKPRDTA